MVNVAENVHGYSSWPEWLTHALSSTCAGCVKCWDKKRRNTWPPWRLQRRQLLSVRQKWGNVRGRWKKGENRRDSSLCKINMTSSSGESVEPSLASMYLSLLTHSCWSPCERLCVKLLFPTYSSLSHLDGDLAQYIDHASDKDSAPWCSKPFFSQSSFSADSHLVFMQPPCAITCINVYSEHVQNLTHWQPYYSLGMWKYNP